jgi:hypothetical protein
MPNRCSEYITTILWPFALKCCEDRLNNLVHRAGDQTPYKMLAGLESSRIIMTNFHTLGCPCYVLDHRLQSGNGAVPKWEPRARIGIYIGHSPSHFLTLHLSLIQRLAMSHLNSTLSLMMILPRCHIFALARSHGIGRTLYVPLPRFRCILIGGPAHSFPSFFLFWREADEIFLFWPDARNWTDQHQTAADFSTPWKSPPPMIAKLRSLSSGAGCLIH